MHLSTSRRGPARARRWLAGVLLVAAVGALAPAPAGAATIRWSTYHGGLHWDEAYDVDVDAAGNSYVVGFTNSANLRVKTARQPRFGGVSDGFVAKYAPGGALVWSTYLGGSKFDIATSVAVDDAGNVFVAGRTESANFPVRNAFQPRLRGVGCQNVPCHDAFVTKLNTGGGLVYSTYLGGTNNEDAVGIAVDGAGAAYVSGNTDSFDFPTRNAFQGSFQTPPCTGDFPCSPDTFVAKLGAGGNTLVYGTYLGGGDSDTNGGIAVDSAGQALVVGSTRSTDFPTRNALQPRIKGVACGPPPGVPCRDVYVTRLTAGGGAAVFSTYLGGTRDEASGGIAVDSGGNVYVTGRTGSFDFPTARAAQASLGNTVCNTTTPVREFCDDAFVTKLAPRGGALAYSTYLGAGASDQGLGIAVTDAGAAVVTGRTDSPGFRSVNAVQPRFGGVSDGFLTRFTLAGGIAASTFLGGTDSERSNGVGLDDAGGAVVAGRTLSLNYPTVRAAQAASAGDYDAFATSVR